MLRDYTSKDISEEYDHAPEAGAEAAIRPRAGRRQGALPGSVT